LGPPLLPPAMLARLFITSPACGWSGSPRSCAAGLPTTPASASACQAAGARAVLL